MNGEHDRRDKQRQDQYGDQEDKTGVYPAATVTAHQLVDEQGPRTGLQERGG